MKKLIEKRCLNCNKEFEVDEKRKDAKYCKWSCYSEDIRKIRQKTGSLKLRAKRLKYFAYTLYLLAIAATITIAIQYFT